MALAAEGGYDAVVMRDLADQANVSVGTIYNYFTSKDHLLASAWVEWVTDLEERIGGHPPRGDTPAERVMDVLGRVCTALGRQPKLVSAILTAATSNDPQVVECQEEVTTMIYGMIARALDLGDREEEMRINEVLCHILHSALLAWTNSRMEMSQVIGVLDNAAHLLFDWRGSAILPATPEPGRLTPAWTRFPPAGPVLDRPTL